MSKTERSRMTKNYSNKTVFEKREKEFKIKTLYELNSKNNKKIKYNWFKKLIKKNANFSFPILSTSMTYIISDTKKQLNIRDKILKSSFINKSINKYILKKDDKLHSEIQTTFLTDQNLKKKIKKVTKSTSRKKISKIIDELKNRTNSNNYTDNSFNYFLFNNFSSSPNADILMHFESEKNLFDLSENNGENIKNEIFLKNINYKTKKNVLALDRIKTAQNYKKIFDYKMTKLNIKRETVNNYIPKTVKYKKIQYSSKINQERGRILKENYQNQIELSDDIFISLEKTKKLLNFNFVDKISNYIKFIYSKIESEKNKNVSLINEIITYKNEIKILNNKITKKINERNFILKWIYFQIRIKEKKLTLPSYYRLIIENPETKKNKNEDLPIRRATFRKSSKKLLKSNSSLERISRGYSENKNEHKYKNIDNNYIIEKGLFYNCPLNLSDPVKMNEINKIKTYKNNLIFNSVDEFIEVFTFFENKIIAKLKYYYKLKMIIYKMKKVLLKAENEINENQIRYDNSITQREKDFNELNTYIKYKNKVIQELNLDKYNIHFKPNSYTKKTNENLNIIYLYEKITDLYNTCKSLKLNLKISKEKKPSKKDLNFQTNKILYRLKYITFVADYFSAQFKIYKNSQKGNKEYFIKLKNEIEKNHKIQKAAEQRIKDKENIIKLEKQIEERNNKIYFLPYRKIDLYNNIKDDKEEITSCKVNKIKKIHFDDLLFNK